MNTSDDEELRHERDQTVISDFVSGATVFKNAYIEWIQQEVKACLQKGRNDGVLYDALGGVVNKQFRAKIRRLKVIDTHTLPDTTENLEHKCLELRRLEPDNVIEHYRELKDALTRFEDLTREVLDIRVFLYSNSSDSPTEF